MKSFYIALLTALLLVSAAAVSAATLTNTDGQSYVVEAMVDGQRYRVTLLDGATISLCDYACAIRLVATGQTLAVEPNDSVVISYGVLRVK
jgi:uncharacterized membrane-anchored protein